MEMQRNSRLVDRAFWNFLGASILTTIAGQLAVSTDAAIVSHLMGPRAMAAINMGMPVLTTFLSLNSLLGVGASLLAAKAIGRRDNGEASRVFSAAFYSVLAVGIVVSVLSFAACPWLARVVCGDDALRPMVLSYLHTTCLGVTVLVMTGMVNMMVQSDGRPRLVTMSVAAGAVTNVVLDFVFIKYLGLGIAGSAWATIINYGVTLCIASTHLRRPSCSYRLLRPARVLWHAFKANLTQGMPLMIANVMLSAIVLLINKIVEGALGSDGVYMVAVCIQLLLITFVVLNGVLDAMFAIGGAQLGEGDIVGLGMLNRRVLVFTCGVLLPLTLVTLAVPQVLAIAFGADNPQLSSALCRVLRIFSLLLVPFALTVMMRGMYQVLGHLALSIVVAVGQVGSILAVVYLFTQVFPGEMLWWGFPLASAATIVAQLLVTWRISRRNGASPLTLLPRPDTMTHYSLSTTMDHLPEAMTAVTAWLHDRQVKTAVAADVKAFLSDALDAADGSALADILVRITTDNVEVTVKDALPVSSHPPRHAAKQAFGLTATTHTYPRG